MVNALGVGGKGGGVDLAGGDIAQAQAVFPLVGVNGADIIIFPLVQHGGGDDRAGGDDPDDLPLHQSLGKRRILSLLTNGHLIALGDEPGDVAVAGVVGHAAHGGALLRGFVPVPGGQSQIQLPRYRLGVLVEHLVKITKTEKEDGVRILGLNIQILLHHGGDLSHDYTVFL